MTKPFKFSISWMILVCSGVLLLPCAVLGQVNQVTDTTSTPIPGTGHDYIKMMSETVNPANGSLSIRIGVPTPQGRGLTLPFSFAYDSNGAFGSIISVTGQGTFVNYPLFLSQGGWSYSVPLLSANTTKIIENGYSCPGLIDYVFEDPSGGRHSLYLASIANGQYSNHCSGGTGKLTGGDDMVRAAVTNCPGGGLCYTVAVAEADGTAFLYGSPNAHETVGGIGASLPYTVEDRNGNQLTFTDNNNGAFTVADTLGRTVLSSSGFGSSGNTLTVPGLSAYTLNWTTAPYDVASNATLISGPSCRGMNNASGTNSVISTIVLPNGEEYQFLYDSNYGLIKSITYPNGAVVTYSWGNNSQSEVANFADTLGNQDGCLYKYDSAAITDRYVYYNGSTLALHQHFSYSTSWSSPFSVTSPWLTKTTTVTTYDVLRGVNAEATYTYTPVGIPDQPYQYDIFAYQLPVESSVAYNDWSGSAIRTVHENWVDQFKMQGKQVVDNGTVTSDEFSVFGSGTQITDKYECGSGQTCYNASQFSPPSAYARHTKIQYASFAATPIYTAGPSIFDRPSSVVVYNGSGSEVASTSYSYDGAALTATSGVVNHDHTNYSTSYNNRGNATSISKWVNTSGNSLTWAYTYDDTGQRLSAADPKGNSTGYSFTDAFPACGTPSGSTNAYLSKITDAKGFTQNFTYRYCDGQLNTSIDRNGQTTSYSYETSLNRLGSITYPDHGSITHGYANSGACAQPSSTTILIQGSSDYTETATMDGVCHVTETAITSDPTGTDYAATTYDGMGKTWTVSNPYRSTSDPTYGLTTYTYDAVGRASDEGSAKSILYPDGSNLSTTILGLSATIIDPAGNERILTKDNLGRLASVNEGAGLYTTSYVSDSLDDLTTVNQGSQTRSYVYDSLSRLTSATNPESGLTSYTYPTSTGSGICSGDPSSVCTRTDARSITTTYAYNDALNRLTAKTYSDGTPTATFFYDQAPSSWPAWSGVSFSNANDRMTVACTGSAAGTCTSPQTAVAFSYDPMGRTAGLWQCTSYNCGSSSIWAMPFTYDLAGDIQTWTHPSGFTVTNTISNARQITQIASSLVETNYPANFAQNITYTPWGALSSLTNGCSGSGCTNTVETYTYDDRLQTSEIQLGAGSNLSSFYALTYNHSLPGGTQPSGCPINPSGTSGNNGNVIGYTYTDNKDSTLSHSAFFVYDRVNRLACAQATGNSTYNLAYSYAQDGSGQYGNMTCSSNSYTNGPCNANTFSGTTNRITTSGYSYDAAGNVLSDGTYGYTWDAEGRMKTLTGSGLSETNTYNALGQMVTRVTTAFTSHDLYDPAGQWVGEFTSTYGYWWGQYIRLGGRVVAFNTDGTSSTVFVHKDLENTTHMITGPTGSLIQDQIFYPYGQSWHNLGTWYQQEFAGLDYFDPQDGLYRSLSRAFNPTPGRWLSPDAKGGHIEDPQTLDKYAYARNNPVTITDPTGLDFYLQCQSSDHSGCTQVRIDPHSKDKTWVQADSNGNATIITSDSIRAGQNAATVNGSGVVINGKFQGIYFNNPASGDRNPITLQGDANKGFGGFTFALNGNCGGTCLSSGSFSFAGTHDQAATALGAAGAWSYITDSTLDQYFHPNTQEFRFGSEPSPHFALPNEQILVPGLGEHEGVMEPNPLSAVPANGDFHVDAGAGFGHAIHAICGELGLGC